MIALLCSVQAEAELLLAKTSSTRTTRIGSKLIVEGTIANREILICIGGMGKVNAAHAATLLLTRFNSEVLIIFGIAGAYPASGAQIGDVALAKEEIAGDEGVLTNDGFKGTEYIGIPLLKTATSVIYNKYSAPEHLTARSCEILLPFQGTGYGKVHCGSFVTLSTCSGTSERARELEKRYNGLCENMEGAAVAHVCAAHEVPWIEVRGISNMVEDRDLRHWDIAKAAAAVQTAVLRILDRWQY